MRSRLRRAAGLALPVLFACLYPTLSAWVPNRAELTPRMLARPLGATLGLALLLALVLLPFCRRSATRLSLGLTSTLLVFFSFDLVRDYIAPNVMYLGEFLGVNLGLRMPYLIARGLAFLTFVTILVALRHPRLTGERALPALLILTSTQLVACSLPLLRPVSPALTSKSLPTPSVTTAPYRRPPSAPRASSLPDLYCIVLDGYGRQDQLKALFGLDNEPFLKQLEQRGFFVARKSRANYLQTPLALSAAFNLDYLPSADEGEIGIATNLLNQSRLFSLLRKKEFQIISVPTNVAQTKLEIADLTFEAFEGIEATFSPLDRLVLHKCPLDYLLDNENEAFDEHRSRLLGALEINLPAAAAVGGPKVVFAHILAPHPPFVFGPNGEPRIPSRTSFTLGDANDYRNKSTPAAYRQGYADQLTFLNQKVLATLDALKAKQTRPAILVLMGDHGSRMETDWKSLERTNLNEPFANLMAVSTPDGQAGALLTDSVTPINVFRLLFTRYYDQDYPRLPDRSFYSTINKPFSFTDVTERL